ncbi:hypothetical protein ACJZ2D_011582 [Fusarium nematophilum]
MLFQSLVFGLAAPALMVEAAVPGNTKVDLDKHRINWGTTPPWDALDHLHQKCEQNGCTSPFKVPTQIVSGDDIHDAHITISAEMISQNRKMTNNLVELAKAVSAGHGNKKTYKVVKKKYHPNKTGCCPPVGCCICDSGDPESADQYHLTNRITIVLKDDDNDLHGQLEVQMKVSLNVGGDDQMCEDLTTIGAACAGAVHGIAGGIFSMISLAC